MPEGHKEKWIKKRKERWKRNLFHGRSLPNTESYLETGKDVVADEIPYIRKLEERLGEIPGFLCMVIPGSTFRGYAQKTEGHDLDIVVMVEENVPEFSIQQIIETFKKDMGEDNPWEDIEWKLHVVPDLDNEVFEFDNPWLSALATDLVFPGTRGNEELRSKIRVIMSKWTSDEKEYWIQSLAWKVLAHWSAVKDLEELPKPITHGLVTEGEYLDYKDAVREKIEQKVRFLYDEEYRQLLHEKED